MPADKIDWRHWWQKEQQLIRELALMLLMAVVVGVYFLEHSRIAMEQSQRQSAEALAQQLATSAAEYLASDNLVSLNVMASQTAALALVSRVEIRNAADRVVASAGDATPGPLSASRPVRIEDQALVGTVMIWPQHIDAERARRLETRFVLVALSLLGFRLLAELAWRRLRAEPELAEQEELEADLVPLLTMNQTSESPRAWLRIGIVNFDRMKQRFTSDMLRESLEDYGKLLHQVAEVYGGKVQQGIGEEAALVISADTRAEACFQALCAGTLFRRLAREVSEQRKEQGRTPLEFKLLVTTGSDLAHSWALCLAGLPGRVHVPESEMVRYELDTRLLFHGERCLNVLSDGDTVRLQPIEQLAQRYQKLIADQAARLL
jgi:class 3 adenylate cyclase